VKEERQEFAWQRMKLGDAVTLQRGKDLPVQERVSGPFPVIGSSGIVGYHSHFVAKGPGVLVGRSGSVGSLTWIERDYWPLNTSLWVSDFHGNDPRFIYYFLEFLDLGKFTGGVSVPTLNRNTVHPLDVELPNVQEQRAIAHALDAVRQARESRQEELALERERKAALMNHLFTYGTRSEPTKQTEIGTIPESWCVTRLIERYETQLGKMLSQKARQGRNSKPYIRNANVKWGRVDIKDVFKMDFTEAEQERFRLRRYDLLVCEGGEIGRTAVWLDELPECFFQKAIHRLRPKSTDVLAHFILYWMEWAFRLANVYRVQGTKTTIAHLPQDKLEQLKIPQPDTEEQKRIISILNCCDLTVEALEKEIYLLDEFFTAMRGELMAGRFSILPLLGEHQSR
jgi:type I restriction enzyme, S subunit